MSNFMRTLKTYWWKIGFLSTGMMLVVSFLMFVSATRAPSPDSEVLLATGFSSIFSALLCYLFFLAFLDSWHQKKPRPRIYICRHNGLTMAAAAMDLELEIQMRDRKATAYLEYRGEE